MFKLISVRDIKADLWFNPQCTPSLGGAIRQFGDQCKTPGHDNPFATHPEDYELYELGEWHEESGTFKLLERPKQIANGGDYKKV